MKYATAAIKDYLADAASDKPAPGGGSVSALVGALAGSMSEMAANFTSGKKKYKSVQAQVSEHLECLAISRRDLLDLVDGDVAAYTAVGQAYGMPGETDKQKAARAAAIQNALREALVVPLAVMRECATIAEAAEGLVRIANPNLLTDVGVSAILAEAACAAARLNVEVNLKFIKDKAFVAQVRPELDTLTQATAQGRESVSGAVGNYLSK